MKISLENAGVPLSQYFDYKRQADVIKVNMDAISTAFKTNPDIEHNKPYVVQWGEKYYSFEVSVATRRTVDNAKVAEALRRHNDDIENYKKSCVVKTFNASEAQLLEQL